MRNFHLSCKFCTLTINFSEVEWPNVLNTFRRPVNKNSLTWWHVLKISLQDVLKMSWRQFCKTSWRRLEDVWPRRLYWSWPRRLEDVLKTYDWGEYIFLDQDHNERRLHQDNVCCVYSGHLDTAIMFACKYWFCKNIVGSKRRPCWCRTSQKYFVLLPLLLWYRTIHNSVASKSTCYSDSFTSKIF